VKAEFEGMSLDELRELDWLIETRSLRSPELDYLMEWTAEDKWVAGARASAIIRWLQAHEERNR
jgi:hypothetical protein